MLLRVSIQREGCAYVQFSSESEILSICYSIFGGGIAKGSVDESGCGAIILCCTLCMV